MEQRTLEEQTVERLIAARADWTEAGQSALLEIRQLKMWIEAWWLSDDPVDILVDLEEDLLEAEAAEREAANWCKRIDAWILDVEAP